MPSLYMKRKLINIIAAVLMLVSVALPVSAKEAKGCSLPIFDGEPAWRAADIVQGENNAKADNKAQTHVTKGLCADGRTFGVRLFTDGVLVVGVGSEADKSPAAKVGIKPCDMIIKIDDVDMRSVGQVVDAISSSGGKTVRVTCRRGSEELTFELTPAVDEADGKYRAGMMIRDNASGIGTVTFIDPVTGAFGGLGHGICDGDTGMLIPISRGAVMDVSITGIKKGVAGKPGELQGALKSQKTGTLISNTECGVFGIFAPAPQGLSICETADKSQVHTGKAYIRCTLGEQTSTDYEIKITEIDRDAEGSKCFALTVTDSRLIEKTGGIIQGMSGSPIIQDGKLIGAVTHVLIGEPRKGYGIFLDNMLVNMPLLTR